MIDATGYDTGLDTVQAGGVPVSLNIDALARKYLAKLESLAGDVLGLWNEYQPVTYENLYTSMRYLICVPEKLNDFERSRMHPQSPRVSQPNQILETLVRAHDFDQRKPDLSMDFNPSNSAYFEISEHDFSHDIRAKVVRAWIEQLGFKPDKSGHLMDLFLRQVYGFDVESFLSLETFESKTTKENLSKQIEINVCAYLRGNFSSREVLSGVSILRLRNYKNPILAHPDRFLITDGQYQHGFTVPSATELDDPVQKDELIKRIISYDLSESGEIAPIGILPIKHLVAARDLLAKKLAEIKYRADRLEKALSE